MSQLTMQSLLEFRRLAGLGDAPPRRLYSGQTEFETDEEFFCRQRAMQSATQLAHKDCSPGGPAFFEDAPVGSKAWNLCVGARYRMYAQRFIEACERAEELATLQYYQSQQRVMTAGGKVPWSGSTRRRRKSDDEEGMKPFTGGRLPPSGVWPLPPVEPPTVKAGFPVQKQPTVILPMPAPRTTNVAPLRTAVPTAAPPARAVTPAMNAPTRAPQAAILTQSTAARAARTRTGAALSGTPGYAGLDLFKFAVGFFAGYWLMTDFLKKGRGS